MDAAGEDVLDFMSFPNDHWPKIASTNGPERFNKEIERRSNVVGIFPNHAAMIRLAGAILLEQNDHWQVCRRYLSLESLKPLIGNDDVPSSETRLRCGLVATLYVGLRLGYGRRMSHRSRDRRHAIRAANRAAAAGRAANATSDNPIDNHRLPNSRGPTA